MPKEYELAGESKALYNGARDTEDGLWIRIRDENDRRILAAAVEKQKKNRDASIGTLTALDPNAGHLTDYIGVALDRVLEGINGARPATAQLDGTPMGAAIGDGAAPAPAKTKGKRGGKPSSVGDVLKTVEGGPLTPSAAGAINWADTVPTPRPEPGQTIQTAHGVSTTIVTPIGYDGEAHAFRVSDDGKWQGLVYWHAPGNVWRVTAQALDYPDEPAASGTDAGETLGDVQDAAAAEREADAVRAGAVQDTPEPAAVPVSPQRARNARHAGLGKPDKGARAVPPTPAAKKPAAKKRK